jgi:hypothetical protein
MNQCSQTDEENIWKYNVQKYTIGNFSGRYRPDNGKCTPQ